MKTCKAADAPELPQRGRYLSLSLLAERSQEQRAASQANQRMLGGSRSRLSRLAKESRLGKIHCLHGARFVGPRRL
jgi:hypothetical protein